MNRLQHAVYLLYDRLSVGNGSLTERTRMSDKNRRRCSPSVCRYTVGLLLLHLL